MLPQLNCQLDYFKNFLSKEEAHLLYEDLLNTYQIASLNEKVMQGKTFLSKNGKLMFIDEELYAANKFPETQWGKTAVWSERLLQIRARVEALAKRPFQVAVCIYYPDGNTGVGYHSDYSAFGDTTVIPSLSIGEEREFLLREKSSQQEHKMLLTEGSLLIMGEHCQPRYEHCLPVNPSYKNGRINITFRQYGFPNN